MHRFLDRPKKHRFIGERKMHCSVVSKKAQLRNAEKHTGFLFKKLAPGRPAQKRTAELGPTCYTATCLADAKKSCDVVVLIFYISLARCSRNSLMICGHCTISGGLENLPPNQKDSCVELVHTLFRFVDDRHNAEAYLRPPELPPFDFRKLSGVVGINQ
ncbi:hypothetical protein B0H12DRAFT_1083405, partial [Mycena haematopus]